MGVLIRILFWGILIGSGWMTGARYGAPEWATSMVSPIFEKIEGWTGALNQDANQAAADPETPTVPAETAAKKPPAKSGGLSQNANLQINKAGIDLIKHHEGLRLESYSADGRSYIGYGHQQKSGDPTKISEAEADRLLREDLRTAENGVRNAITVPANENEFSAMVSFAYNIGVGGYSRSNVLAAFNNGDRNGAADAFLTSNTVGGKFNQYIYDRRVLERALFLTPA